MLKPADWLVVALSAAVIGVLALTQWRPAAPAASLEVRGIDGVIEMRLDRNARLLVAGPLGESVIEIRDGRARFVRAPCRHRVCIATGWIANDGDFAACVPNRVSLRAVARDSRYDAINY